jgi:outer membrane protein TolC
MKRSLFMLLALLAAGGAAANAITLDQALAQALENNPQILQARSALDAAAGERIVLRSVVYPKALLGSVAGDQGGQRSRTSGDQPFIFAYGFFAQPLFHAAIPASLRRGDVTVLLAQQQLNVAVMGELHRARLAFYRALYNRSLESSGRAQLQRLEENLAGEQTRYEAGQGDRSSVTAATLLTRELEPKIESARNAYGSAVIDLAEALGHPLGANATIPNPEGTLDFQNTSVHWQSGLQNALQNRADLKLARLLVRAGREDQRIVAAGYYPAIGAVVAGDVIPVTGIYRNSGGSPQSTDNTIANEVAAGATYTWRVIDNGRVGGAVAEQRALAEANELELQKLETNVPRELAQLQNTLQAIDARYRSLVSAAELAESNVKSVEENRAEGLASILDFRSAENSLLVTRRGLLSAIYEQQLALAEWDRATGRYFQFSGDTGAKVH